MLVNEADAVIVGDMRDPHVRAVCAELDDLSTMVLDVESLSSASFRLHHSYFEYNSKGQTLSLLSDRPARGWIRRIAPPDWHRGLVLESHTAAIKSAWLSLLVAVIRTCAVTWLTEVDPLVGAENKLVQIAIAERLGIAVPETIVTNEPEAAVEALGGEVVLKPVGPGHFFDADTPLVVYAKAVAVGGVEMSALGTAPFLAQKHLRAKRHLRIVTVGDRAWAAGLDAEDYPLDWRKAPEAHISFLPELAPPEVTDNAIRVATELHLGYSSQDWAVCDDGCYMLDVNPAGQWLFLPSEVAAEVSSAIADWLRKETRI